MSLGAIGCNKPLPNPELKDPIYLDLVGSIEEKTAIAEDKRNLLKSSYIELEKAKSKPSEYIEKKNQYFKALEDVAVAEQNLRFYQIRAESRLIWIRNEYLESFKAGKEYSFGQSFDHYQKNKELQNSNRMWIRGDPKFRQAQDGGI
jgi:hypothetical protein